MDFSPAKKVEGVHSLSRPSLSYWQDAWIRFRKNKQSVISLWIVVALALFSLVGPLVWQVDPTEQDLSRVSTPPQWSRAKALVVGETNYLEPVVRTDWPTAPDVDQPIEGPPQNLRVQGNPTMQSVQLVWEPVSGASSYAIYRNEERAPVSPNWGVPLGETFAGNVVSYEDYSSLEVKTYFYTVVPKTLMGDESDQVATLQVSPLRTMSLIDAQQRDPNVQEGETISLRPIPLGTDLLGRDMLARLMFGGKISLFIGIFTAILYTFLGVVIGGIAGYYGGKVDQYIMRFTDFVMGLPFLLFMILLSVVLAKGPGESGVTALILAMVLLSWTGPARLVRGQVLQIRESEFVHAARLLGAKPQYLLFRHLVPNLLGVILISMTFSIPAAIFTEAFLSFIGLGVAAPAASWGSMCTDGVQTFLVTPHEFFAPGVCISLTVLAFNLLGDGLRDALDPRLRSTE